MLLSEFQAVSIHWAYGSTGTGVPVAGGFDMDGDGSNDYPVGHFRATANGLANAGEVNLILGNGTVGGFVKTSVNSSRLKLNTTNK